MDRAGEAVLWRRAREGCRDARRDLVARHLPLVRHIAFRFRSAGLEEEDLIQVGSLGLIKAVERFDPGRGTRFSTYAVPLIAGEILHWLRGQGPVKVSREKRSLAHRFGVLRERLRREWGREPSYAELSRELGVSAEELVAVREAFLPARSLQERAEFEDNAHLLLERIPAPENTEELGISRVQLAQSLSVLDARSRRIVEMRFFEDRTQEEIALEIGISQGQVSRLLKRALALLRAQLDG